MESFALLIYNFNSEQNLRTQILKTVFSSLKTLWCMPYWKEKDTQVFHAVLKVDLVRSLESRPNFFSNEAAGHQTY